MLGQSVARYRGSIRILTRKKHKSLVVSRKNVQSGLWQRFLICLSGTRSPVPPRAVRSAKPNGIWRYGATSPLNKRLRLELVLSEAKGLSRESRYRRL